MLANGERILADGAIPRTNVFSWVHPDHAYLNDKWGFMVLVAAVERVGGAAGLGVLKMALGGALAGLLQALARRSLPPWRAAGVACLAITMLSYRLHLRAEWVSYLGVAATLLLLPGVLAGRRRAFLLQLALIPLWAACHGYWVLGPLLVGAAAVGARSWRGAATALGCAAMAVVSPYGVGNVLHPFRVLGSVGGPLAEAVTEMRAPFSGDAPVTFFHVLAVLLTLVAGAALLREARAGRLERALVIAVLVAVAWKLDRNLGIVGLTVPLAASAAPALGAALPWGGWLALVAIGGTAAGVPRIAGDRQLGIGEHPGRFPAELLRRMPEEWAGERYVNDFSLGSWLVRARGTAFIDGNAEGYPPEFLARYRRLLSGEESAQALEDELSPDGWLLRTSAAHTRVLVLWLFVTGRHAPAAWDDVATLFRPQPDPEAGDAAWRAWLQQAYLPRASSWFVPAAEAEAAARAAAPGAGELAILRASVEQAPWEPALYRRMADEYARRGDLRNAARCRRWAYLLADSP
jgi:hypothetical protein